MTKRWTLPTLNEAGVEAWARRLGPWLAGQIATDHPTLTVGLTGGLGAGKTTVVKAMVSGLGADDRTVTSPTYSILHIYPTEPEVRHLDLYRLQHAFELEELGFDELLEAPGLNFIEWIDRVPGAAPADRLEIELAVQPGDVRDILIQAFGVWSERIQGVPCP